jgi:hypothetical protein
MPLASCNPLRSNKKTILQKYPYCVYFSSNYEDSKNPFDEPYSFIVAEAFVLQNDNSVTLATHDTANHTIPLFFHRPNSEDDTPWRLVICDPNYSSSEDVRHKRALIPLVQQIHSIVKQTSYFNRTLKLGDFVEFHRCMNLNVCMDHGTAGICFASLCAALDATKNYVAKLSLSKARDGTQLMHYLLDATHRARDTAAHVLMSIYAPAPFSMINRHVVKRHLAQPSRRKQSPFSHRSNESSSSDSQAHSKSPSDQSSDSDHSRNI